MEKNARDAERTRIQLGELDEKVERLVDQVAGLRARLDVMKAFLAWALDEDFANFKAFGLEQQEEEVR